MIFKVGHNNLSCHVYLFLVVLLIFKVGRNNSSGHVYLFLVVLMILKVGRNNLRDHVYLFLVVLLIFKVGRNSLSGHVYVFHIVMTCYTSSCQHKTTRPCKHYRNIRGGGGGSIDASVIKWLEGVTVEFGTCVHCPKAEADLSDGENCK